MAFPDGWPPRPAGSVRSIRFFKQAQATANYSDTAYLFADLAGANTFLPTPYVPRGGITTPAAVGTRLVTGVPMGGGQDAHDADLTKSAPVDQSVPHTMIWSHGIRICNDEGVGGGDLTFSFDGTNDHGVLKAGEKVVYRNRHEAGITLKGNGVHFRVEAW